MTFQSVHHPGDTSRPWLALQAQARPVALALLAVMTVGLAAAMQGEDILWPFVGGTAIAYGVAVIVGQGRLLSTPAQVDVRGPFAAVHSVWQAAASPPEGALAPVSSARLQHGELSVGLGDTVVTFEPADWPDFDALVAAFRAAAAEGHRLLETPDP